MTTPGTLRIRSREGLLAILFLGSLWGAVEAVGGGLLHRLLPPTYPGPVMLAVAMAVLAYAVRTTGSPWVPVGMGLVAAPLKLTSALFYALPVTAPEVLNPALAILAASAHCAAICTCGRSAALISSMRFLIWNLMAKSNGSSLRMSIRIALKLSRLKRC